MMGGGKTYFHIRLVYDSIYAVLIYRYGRRK